MWILYKNKGELLYKNELVVRLSKSESALLALLIESVEKLVDKEDLMDVGWPGKFVAPNSLNTAIKHIRRAIKRSDSELSIETVYRRGYILHKHKHKVIVLEDMVARGLDNIDHEDDGNPRNLNKVNSSESAVSSDDLCNEVDTSLNDVLVSKNQGVNLEGMRCRVGVNSPTAISFVGNEWSDNIRSDRDNYTRIEAPYDASIASEAASETAKSSDYQSLDRVAVGSSLMVSTWTRLPLYLGNIFFVLLLLMAITIAMMVFLAKKELYCIHPREDVKVCGVFELPRHKEKFVMSKVKGQKGLHIYGYNRKLEKIEIHRVN